LQQLAYRFGVCNGNLLFEQQVVADTIEQGA
jgi:hypothetical protein